MAKTGRHILLFLSLGLVLVLSAQPARGQEGAASPLDHLFGSRVVASDALDDLPQWLSVLHRHLRDDVPGQAVLTEWFALLQELRGQPPRTQLQRVNDFINRKPYILDQVNYGQEDYWAIVKEFMTLAGDCEDFSISKFFSLRFLGFAPEDLRLVILQDTNLGIAHAVLAVRLDAQVLILDNQTNALLTDRQIIHYTPLYSVNEEHWWLHLPPI